MRVLQVVKRRQLRGAEVFAYELSQKLEQKGHSTSIAYLYGTDGDGLALRAQDSELDAVEEHAAERVPGFQPRLLRRLEAAVRSFAPDIVQVNGSRTVKYGGLLRWRSPRAPWGLVYRSIGTSADWLVGSWRRALYSRLVLSRMDAIAAVTRDSAAGFKDGVAAGCACVQIPRGVDLESFVVATGRADVRRDLGTPLDRRVIIVVGSLSPEKRPDRALRVAAEVARRVPDLELWLVGDGPLRGEVEREATESPAEVRVLGARRDIASLMGAADLLLLTSDTEGTPGVLLEAAAVGLPAVATRVGGVADCVHEGKTALLADRSDEQALADHAVALLDDSAVRARIGAEARAWVRAGFSLDEIAGRYLDLYATVVARRRERLGKGA